MDKPFMLLNAASMALILAFYGTVAIGIVIGVQAIVRISHALVRISQSLTEMASEVRVTGRR